MPMLLLNDEVPPWYALLGGVAGTVATKVGTFIEKTKYLIENLYNNIISRLNERTFM